MVCWFGTAQETDPDAVWNDIAFPPLARAALSPSCVGVGLFFAPCILGASSGQSSGGTPPEQHDERRKQGSNNNAIQHQTHSTERTEWAVYSLIIIVLLAAD